MYVRLGEATLTTGAPMEIGVIQGPDAEWRDRIVPFLDHKGPDFNAHTRAALEGRLDDLETRFYIGHLDGRPITHVMIVGARGVGILGHVYTLPEERRKGAYAALMPVQMADIARQGYRVLCLGTGFESHPYWIYHAHRFRSIGPGRGQMKWLAHPGAEAECFAPASVRVRDARWDDWGWMDLLGMQPPDAEDELPRAPALGLKDYGSLEGPWCAFQWRRQRDPRIQARVLETDDGRTVGWCILAPDTRWFADTWVLDVYVHPNFRREAARLLEGLTWPERPVAAYLSCPRGWRAEILRQLQFEPIATLSHWLRAERGEIDLAIWVRQPLL